MVSPRDPESIGFEYMVGVTAPLLGRDAVSLEEKLHAISPEHQLLAHRLWGLVCPLHEATKYCYRIVQVVLRLASIERQTLAERDLGFRLMKLQDFCTGLPADDELVRRILVFAGEGHSPGVRIAAAESVGYLRGGGASGVAALLPMLAGRDPDLLRICAQALDRMLRVQAGLAEECAGWLKQTESTYTSVSREVRDVRRQLASLAQDRLLAEVLRDAGCVSELDLMVVAQEQDGEWFRRHRDSLLRAYRGQYVAIRNGEVLGFGKDPRQLQRVIDEKAGSTARAFVAKVVPESFERVPESSLFLG